MEEVEIIYSEYDSNGNMTYSKNVCGYEVWYEYNSNGKLVSKKDNNGLLWEYDKDTPAKEWVWNSNG